jgi:hypothetical protein
LSGEKLFLFSIIHSDNTRGKQVTAYLIFFLKRYSASANAAASSCMVRSARHH